MQSVPQKNGNKKADLKKQSFRPAKHYDFLLALVSVIALVAAIGQDDKSEKRPPAQCASTASFVSFSENVAPAEQPAPVNHKRRPAAGAAALIDINRENAAQLQQLPGVGPVLARRIIDYRAAHGRFTEPADLMKVPGIGPKKFSTIAPLIVIGNADDGG